MNDSSGVLQFISSDDAWEVINPDIFGDGAHMAIWSQGIIGLVSVLEHEDDWYLAITCGVAIDVPDIDGSLRFSNIQNRRIAFGRYYSAVAEEQGVAAVVYEHLILGESIDLSSESSRRNVLWVVALLMADAAATSGEFIARHGGSPFSREAPEILAVIRA